MPVDVEDEDGKRYPAFFEVFQEFLHLFFGVVPEFAPPVAEGISRKEGRKSAYAVEVFQTDLIIVPVTEEIKIEISGIASFEPAVFSENISFGIVHDAISVPGHEPVFQFQTAVGSVQSPVGPFEIPERKPSESPEIFSVQVISPFDF